jgi:hypothetical protein
VAFEIVKAMQADGLQMGDSYRPLACHSLAEVIAT